MNSVTKEITINELALMVAKGFEEVGKDIKIIKKELVEIKSILSMHDFALRNHEGRIVRIEDGEL